MESFSTVMVVVALALIDGKGRVLLQQRPANKQHGGLWEFPGGKVEPGESCEQAIVREIDEELGLAVEASALFPISFANQVTSPGGRSIVLLLYGAREWSGVPAALEPGSAILWVDGKEMMALPLPPLDVPLARAIIPLLEGVAKAETAP
jgi:8-oxo-dGTP diphosphatase